MAGSNASPGLAATFGANLRAARKARGMKQRELAEAMGLKDFMAISRWERGEHRPKDENLIALCEALDISVASLYEIHEQAA